MLLEQSQEFPISNKYLFLRLFCQNSPHSKSSNACDKVLCTKQKKSVGTIDLDKARRGQASTFLQLPKMPCTQIIHQGSLNLVGFILLLIHSGGIQVFLPSRQLDSVLSRRRVFIKTRKHAEL